MIIFSVSTAGLHTDEKDELIKQFKLAYDHDGLHDLKSQVPFLSQLAKHYKSLGVSSGNDWVHLIKVIGIATHRVMSYDSIAIRIGNRMFGHLCIIIRHTACTTHAMQGTTTPIGKDEPTRCRHTTGMTTSHSAMRRV